MAGTSSQSKRLEFVDIAKGIGMLCVIAGHLSIREVNSVIFTFHMPLFFLISGWFFRPARNWKEGLAKRAKRLLAPYLLCSVACAFGAGVERIIEGRLDESWNAVADMFLTTLYGSGSLKSPVIGIPSFGAIWFLLGLFWALTIYDGIVGKRWTTPVVLALFFVGVATRDWWLPFSIQAGMCVLLFVHIGWLARSFVENPKLRLGAMLSRGIPPWMIGICAVAWLIAWQLDGGEMYLVANFFTCIPVDVIGAVAGSILVIWFARCLAHVPILSKGLAYFGRNSLTVLCLHMFEMNIIPWWDIIVSLNIADDTWEMWQLNLLGFSIKLLWACIGLFLLWLWNHMCKARKDGQDIEQQLVPSARPRIRSYDIAKGIAILLCVVGHQADIDPVARALIFSFHMPFFFLVNAAFVSSEYDVRRTLRRSVRTLIVPYVVVCILAAGLKGLLTPEETKAAIAERLVAMLGGVSTVGKVFPFLKSVWLVWFVACLFVARNIYVIARRATQKSPMTVQFAVPLALFALGWWLGENGLYLPWSLDVALFAQVFFLVGDETRRRGLLEAPTHPALLLAAIATWVALALGGYQIEMATRDYPGFVACVLGACLGSWLVFLASKWFDTLTSNLGEAVSRLFAWAGQESMVILGIHCLRMMWTTWGSNGSDGAFSSTLGWAGNGLVEVAFCLATCYTFRRMLSARSR